LVPYCRDDRSSGLTADHDVVNGSFCGLAAFAGRDGVGVVVEVRVGLAVGVVSEKQG
jgi:hypothetical protein